MDRVKPRTRWTLFTLALVVFGASGYLLGTGSPWLERVAVTGIGLPLGNLIAWAGMLALPAAIWLAFLPVLGSHSPVVRTMRVLLLVSLGLAAGWGVVCYGLSGNWAFNFAAGPGAFRGSATAATMFWAYSAAVVLLPLLTLPVLLVIRWFAAGRGGREG